MRRIERQKAVFYVSEALESYPNVVHAVTTRHGGVSLAPFNTMNLGNQVGDEPANVRENLERMHTALGLDVCATVDASQAQADRVARVTDADRGTRVKDVDGLITNEPGIPLMLRFADCVPVLLYDPAHRAIGIAHAGWRGTVGRVVTRTVQAMGEAFGTSPRDLIACICPSIGPCCYEIGPDVRDRVEQVFSTASQLLLRQNGSIHLDLWEANAHQLRTLGVEQIEVAGLCTSDRTDEWYSWRREKGETGRFAAIIALR
ncbi:MAG: peptidoglycan editing factor PgeF [Anaerolineae bacterium]